MRAMSSESRELIEVGCETIALADTDGQATPLDVQRVLVRLIDAKLDIAKLGVHLHDRFGYAIANAWEAYRLGVRTFDAALGGVGGNVSVVGSVGNIATERLVAFFRSMNIETGIDMAVLDEALKIVREMIQLQEQGA